MLLGETRRTGYSLRGCDEPAREIAIRAYLDSGGRAAALRHFRQYRDVLQSELQCETVRRARGAGRRNGLTPEQPRVGARFSRRRHHEQHFLDGVRACHVV